MLNSVSFAMSLKGAKKIYKMAIKLKKTVKVINLLKSRETMLGERPAHAADMHLWKTLLE